jgi:long-subunit acyl-CoA synthetase (AMP-forming)
MNRCGDNLAALFVSGARDYPNRVFLRWCHGTERITWSYAEAAVRIANLIARLDAIGVGSGDYAVVYTAEIVPSLLFDIACACAGVVFTPIETNSIPAVMDIYARTAAKVVLTTPDRARSFDAVIAEDGLGTTTGTYAQALAFLADRTARLDADSIYMLQPTSGTTGGSKLVIRTHKPFVRVGPLFAFGALREDEPQARVLIVPALTHGMGQYLLAAALWRATEIDVTTRIDVAASIEEIRWLDPTFIVLTPRVLRSLVHQLGGDTTQIFGPSLRHFLSSGAAPDKQLLTAIERTGVTVIEAFGASEVSAVAITRPGSWRPDILGHVLDDVELRVSEDGELQVRSDYKMAGFHGAPELTKAAFTDDGFYCTGDRVTLGPEGEFTYHGRLVDSFNLFDGSHVAPGPLEDAFGHLPWVDQVMLFGDQYPYLVGLLVPTAKYRGRLDRVGRRMFELDAGRICSEFEPNARVHRLAILDRPLPEEMFKFVGHGKIRRVRARALEAFDALVQALYAGTTVDGVPVIDVPGSASELRRWSRHRMSWLVHIGGAEARTIDVSRGGAFIAHDGRIVPSSSLTVEVDDLDGRPAVLQAEVIRREASGSAVRWTGCPNALARLARRVPA